MAYLFVTLSICVMSACYCIAVELTLALFYQNWPARGVTAPVHAVLITRSGNDC